jgi:putative transposase
MQPDMKKRKFIKEENLQIIKEVTEQGVNATLRNMGFIRLHITVGK